MKKTTIIIILSLLVLLSLAGKTYADSRVRSDISDNVKKYNELLIKSSKELKENGKENKEFISDINNFIDKCNSLKTSKNEKDLLCKLMTSTLDYLEMINAKKEGNSDLYTKTFSRFQEDSDKLSNYFKK